MIYHRETVVENFERAVAAVIKEKNRTLFVKKNVVKVCEQDKPFFDVRSAYFLYFFPMKMNGLNLRFLIREKMPCV